MAAYCCDTRGSRGLKGSDLKDVRPMTVWNLLSDANDERPSWKLYELEKGGSMNVSEFYELVRDMAKALVGENLMQGDIVAILGRNGIEYAAAELAAAVAGCVALPLYADGSAEVNEVALQTSGAKLVFCSMSFVHKVMIYRNNLTELRKIVLWAEAEEKIPESEGEIVFWDDFLFAGSELPSEGLNARLKTVKPESPCMLMPVTGASAIKTAMFSQDNITWAARRVVDRLGLTDKDVLPSFVPFYLMTGKLLDIYGALYKGYLVAFLDPRAWQATKSTMITGFVKEKPTVVVAPGFAIEKLQWTIEKDFLLESSKAKAFFMHASLECGRKSSNATMKGKKPPLDFPMHNNNTFSKARNLVGLGKLRFMVTFGNPLSDTVSNYLWNLHIPTAECFEKAEAAGFISLQSPGNFLKGTCGKPLDGLEIRIEKPNDEGVGELQIRGRGVFMGYLGQEAMTKDVFTADGWFITSEYARLDESGFLHHHGHKEDYIQLSTGECVNPAVIENNLKSLVAGVNQVCLVGEGRSSLGALITMKISKKSGKEKLNSSARRFTQAKTVGELQKDVRWNDLMGVALTQINRLATSSATKVTAFRMVEGKWDAANGFAAPGGRLRRSAIAKAHAKDIDAMFAETAKQ